MLGMLIVLAVFPEGLAQENSVFISIKKKIETAQSSCERGGHVLCGSYDAGKESDCRTQAVIVW